MTSAAAATPRNAKPRCLCLQYSLITVLVLLLLASIGISWVSVKLRHARQLQQTVQAIENLGGRVEGVGEEGPDWLKSLLGCDIFLDVGYYVYFTRPAFTNTGLDRLQGWRQLFGLSLEGREVTDATLERIKGLSQLTELDLEATSVTDAGLEYLKGLSQLRRVSFWKDSKVTDEGITKLQQALPNCSVRRIVYKETDTKAAAGRR